MVRLVKQCKRSYFILPSNKIVLREQYRALRRGISTADRKSAAEAASSQLLLHPKLMACQKLACYLPYKSEFDSVPVIEAIWRANKTCYLPVLAKEKLIFVPYYTGDSLVQNQYHILEPASRLGEVDGSELDLVILPLLAFDSGGYRLGTGGGYYDRTFAMRQVAVKPWLVGLGFAIQQADAIPHDKWDVRMDAVLTENGWQAF